MILSACSTSPSITVTSPDFNAPELVVKPPVNIMTGCKPLIQYNSKDTSDVIKNTVENNHLYFLCASKMESATIF